MSSPLRSELVTAIGYHTTISAADPFELGGTIFRFTGWSNAGPRVQDLVVPPEGAELTANYSGTAAERCADAYLADPTAR